MHTVASLVPNSTQSLTHTQAHKINGRGDAVGSACEHAPQIDFCAGQAPAVHDTKFGTVFENINQATTAEWCFFYNDRVLFEFDLMEPQPDNAKSIVVLVQHQRRNVTEAVRLLDRWHSTWHSLQLVPLFLNLELEKKLSTLYNSTLSSTERSTPLKSMSI